MNNTHSPRSNSTRISHQMNLMNTDIFNLNLMSVHQYVIDHIN